MRFREQEETQRSSNMDKWKFQVEAMASESQYMDGPNGQKQLWVDAHVEMGLDSGLWVQAAIFGRHEQRGGKNALGNYMVWSADGQGEARKHFDTNLKIKEKLFQSLNQIKIGTFHW